MRREWDDSGMIEMISDGLAVCPLGSAMCDASKAPPMPRLPRAPRAMARASLLSKMLLAAGLVMALRPLFL